MEWSEATTENDGFSMVLGQPTIGYDGFSMVSHHWSNDGMVTYHRRSLDDDDDDDDDDDLLCWPFQPDNMAAHVSLLSLTSAVKDDDNDDHDNNADYDDGDNDDFLQHGLANITGHNSGAVRGQQSGELSTSAPLTSAW